MFVCPEPTCRCGGLRGLAGWLGCVAIAAVATRHAATAATPEMVAEFDRSTGHATLWEGDEAILRYNYDTVNPPAEFLDQVNPGNRKYARPRSNYIHPLYGLSGEVLTKDWSIDHPHHRGIYWAWPEVDYQGQRADLHAWQGVFARPTGAMVVRSGHGFAEIEAENLWKWNDKLAIVREQAVIRAYSQQADGRYVDLQFSFVALEDDVSLARRETNLYGGLNFRFAPANDLQLVTHQDPDDSHLQRSWGDVLGMWGDSSQVAGVAILEKQSNPHYPGEWVSYPELPWLQPAFPRSGKRFVLRKGVPLVLEYRIWLHRGQLQESEYSEQWRRYQSADRLSAADVSDNQSAAAF